MMHLENDIYYKNDYIALYLKEDEEIFDFKYQEDNKIFINKSIKRPIKKIGNTVLDDEYYDLETAYGYGGFYCNSDDKSFIKEAMNEYENRCKNENIIAEFIRFHPFNYFPLQNANLFDFNIEDRDVIVKKLDDNIMNSYNSKVRNMVKRALEKIEISKSNDIETFQKIYNETMQKNNASDFYYFDNEYYQNLINNKDIELYQCVYDDKIVAMAFFMFGNDIAHYHLSANTELSYKLNSNYALLHYMFEIAKDRGIDYFLLGGGSTSNEDDPLFKFKKKFSKETKPFFISGKIYNQDVYNEYNKIWQEQSNEDIKYFLKYRLEVL